MERFLHLVPSRHMVDHVSCTPRAPTNDIFLLILRHYPFACMTLIFVRATLELVTVHSTTCLDDKRQNPTHNSLIPRAGRRGGWSRANYTVVHAVQFQTWAHETFNA